MTDPTKSSAQRASDELGIGELVSYTGENGNNSIKMDVNGRMIGICGNCKKEYFVEYQNFSLESDLAIAELLKQLVWKERCVSCLRLQDEIDEDGHSKDCIGMQVLSIFSALQSRLKQAEAERDSYRGDAENAVRGLKWYISQEKALRHKEGELRIAVQAMKDARDILRSQTSRMPDIILIRNANNELTTALDAISPLPQ